MRLGWWWSMTGACSGTESSDPAFFCPGLDILVALLGIGPHFLHCIRFLRLLLLLLLLLNRCGRGRRRSGDAGFLLLNHRPATGLLVEFFLVFHLPHLLVRVVVLLVLAFVVLAASVAVADL
jgi:hypothetical protein